MKKIKFKKEMLELNEYELTTLYYLYCYDSKFELTKENIDTDEISVYTRDWDNMKELIEEWFFDYLCDRCYEFEDKKTFYYFVDTSEYYSVDELIENIHNVFEIKTPQDFYEAKNIILKEYDYEE